MTDVIPRKNEGYWCDAEAIYSRYSMVQLGIGDRWGRRLRAELDV